MVSCVFFLGAPPPFLLFFFCDPMSVDEEKELYRFFGPWHDPRDREGMYEYLWARLNESKLRVQYHIEEQESTLHLMKSKQQEMRLEKQDMRVKLEKWQLRLKERLLRSEGQESKLRLELEEVEKLRLELEESKLHSDEEDEEKEEEVVGEDGGEEQDGGLSMRAAYEFMWSRLEESKVCYDQHVAAAAAAAVRSPEEKDGEEKDGEEKDGEEQDQQGSSVSAVAAGGHKVKQRMAPRKCADECNECSACLAVLEYNRQRRAYNRAGTHIAMPHPLAVLLLSSYYCYSSTHSTTHTFYHTHILPHTSTGLRKRGPLCTCGVCRRCKSRVASQKYRGASLLVLCVVDFLFSSSGLFFLCIRKKEVREAQAQADAIVLMV